MHSHCSEATFVMAILDSHASELFHRNTIENVYMNVASFFSRKNYFSKIEMGILREKNLPTYLPILFYLTDRIKIEYN